MPDFLHASKILAAKPKTIAPGRPITLSGRRLNTSLFALPFAYLDCSIKRANTGRLAL
jgi:hypothetical protein